MTNKSNKSWIAWLIIGLCVLAIPVGLIAKQGGSDDGDGSPWSIIGKDTIKVVSIDGPIMHKARASFISLPSGASKAIKVLRKAKKDKKVKGVLIRINSPGGTVGASQELNQAVAELRKEKPVIASMGDIAASGGYYVACACDKIYANQGSLTGSIGVIMSMLNVKGLTDKLGVEPKIVKSGPFKDISSMYRPMTEEEKKILQALIDDTYDQFVTAVARGRKMKVEDVKKLADGRIYTGRQALKNGLIDKTGTYQDALDDLQETCKKKYNLKKELEVDDEDSDSILDMILKSSYGMVKGESNLVDEMLPYSLRARFYNQPLWMMP